MDKDSEVQPLPVSPLPESELRSPTSNVPLTPLETPSRPPTPTSQTREPTFQEEAALNSPPTEEVRNPVDPPVGSQAPTVPVSPQSPPKQPVFSPVREQTPIFVTRERLQVSSPAPPTPKASPAPAHAPPQPPRRRSGRQRVAPTRHGYDGREPYRYHAAPFTWIFEENGLFITPTAFKASASTLALCHSNTQ